MKGGQLEASQVLSCWKTAEVNKEVGSHRRKDSKTDYAAKQAEQSGKKTEVAAVTSFK